MAAKHACSVHAACVQVSRLEARAFDEDAAVGTLADPKVLCIGVEKVVNDLQLTSEPFGRKRNALGSFHNKIAATGRSRL